MKILINNLSEIKDLLWIIFTLIATVIAVLTYRRARFTLLQPLRTEVIKRQTDLLVQLLDYLEDDGVNFYFKVDYMGIISCNAYLLLKHYGFMLKDEAVEEAVKNNVSGMLILKESGMLKSIKLPEVFNDSDQPFEDSSKKDYELAKQGIVNLEILHLTKQHSVCMNKLKYFLDNPFMPQEIQDLLRKILEDISYNLTYPLKEELEKFVVNLCSFRGATEDNPVKIEHNAIYNYFQRKSKGSHTYLKEIRRITRQYLMIDKKWK